MQKYATSLRTLVAAGYRRDRALLAISRAYMLTPEQIVILDRLAK